MWLLIHVILWSRLSLFADAYPNTLLNLPRKTSAYEHPDSVNGWTPRPTRSATQADLRRRSLDPPESICGYSYGDPERPLSCGIGFCGFQDGVVACCSNAEEESGSWVMRNCEFKTTCYDMGECFAGDSCDNDVSAVYCGHGTWNNANSCVKYSWTDGGYEHLACTDGPGVTVPIGIAAVTTSRETDTSTTDSSIASNTGTSSSTSSSASFTTASPTPSPPPQTKEKTGLSPVALAFAIIGPVCSVLGLVFGVGFKIWKHKKKTAEAKADEHARESMLKH